MRTLLVLFFTASVSASIDDPVQAAQALVRRVVPALADKITLELLPSTGTAAMQLDSRDGKVVLRGTGGVELASALNWYLNDYLNATFDWNTYADGQIPTLPGTAPLPLPATSSVVPRRVPWSYYMNVCTLGYSLAFVPWSYWETHIDWMAMNGINMPLGFVGQEWLWAETFKSFNLSLADQASFYSGPAFLPWFRMGNMRGWGGPLTQSWLDKRKALELQLLERMRGLGMKPALGAFAGHVPASFAAKFPGAKISRSPDWAGFDAANPDTAQYADVYLLEPTDPMFATVGSRFIALQANVYGTDHIYQADTYNEMSPPTRDTDYLKRSSAAVYGAMAAADPSAVWLMQGWLFQSSWWRTPQIEAYLGGVASGKMWLLDLFGDSNPIWSKTASFYGHPFIFCTLLNFGGQQGITGNVPRIEAGMQAALDKNSTITGVGITMEGIWTNYPVFERQLQLGWAWPPTAQRELGASSDGWFARFGARRYGGGGAALPAVTSAWTLLGSTVYAGNGGGFGSAISSLPSLEGKKCATPPQGVTPPAPAGYRRRHPQDGYWDPPPAARKNTSVGECAASCDADDACRAFEVYIHFPPDRGDCYPFSDLSRPFVALDGGSRTYIKATEPAAVVAAEALPSRAAATAAAAGVTAIDATTPPSAEAASVYAQAWGLLLSAAPELSAVASYRFDVVDLGREVLAANFSAGFSAYSAAFQRGDKVVVHALAAQLLATIDDYDTLLSSDDNFLVGRWISWARAWGGDDAAKASLELNARNQLTVGDWTRARDSCASGPRTRVDVPLMTRV